MGLDWDINPVRCRSSGLRPNTEVPKPQRRDLIARLTRAIDAGGSLTIKKQYPNPRKPKRGINPTYAARITVKRVEPDLPMLMKEVFGGRVSIERQSRRRAPPRYIYDAGERRAITIITALLPYLQKKRRQADLILELGRWKEHSQAGRFSWWWVNRHHRWQHMAMMTCVEARRALSYKDRSSVRRVLYHRLLIALPAVTNGGRAHRRFPRPLINDLASLKKKRGHRALLANPPPLLETYEQLYQAVRLLNQKARISRMFRADGTR